MLFTIGATTIAKQKNSLKNPISCATNRATLSGWTIVGQYIDNGISGATREKRAELQRLLRDTKKKKFDAVIAKSVSSGSC
ncbi:recombinase family protein [Paenibacillus sp. NPDC058910]|uniref:recombinase family protein n=1 Tax=unclassified Paenibacillus TaxID=185978 RepID=UPI0036BCE02E